MVSHPGGRWAKELIVADAAMQAAAGLRRVPEQNIVQPGAQLLGFAVLQGWRVLSGTAPSDHAYGFVRIHQKMWRRQRNAVYLEHKVLCRCCLVQGINMLPRWLTIKPQLAVQELLSAPTLADALVRKRDGGSVMALRDVLTEWRLCFSVRRDRCVLWGSRRSWRPPWCQVPA